MLCCYAVLFDTIWNTRNRIIHDNDVVWSVDQARREIHKRYLEFSSVFASCLSGPGEVSDTNVSLHISTNLVLVVDGSFSNGRYGCGALAFRNNSSDWFFCSSYGACGSALAVELEAILFGIKWALDTGWDRVSIASDSMQLVNAFRVKKPPDWQLAAHLRAIVL
ncbi:hypothetical protein G4B88_030559 [Cannabis sativa]|uniref:RNase H type-1 domain-containing protein n=1 Tax=Cannabis sativa TaxID=3483 RepID=A0A7J6EIU5_CANSA|nr:hypothetical protein G4B88_030559 [Cannabis sativa]